MTNDKKVLDTRTNIIYDSLREFASKNELNYGSVRTKRWRGKMSYLIDVEKGESTEYGYKI
ncbi:MAG: hypothetical protein ACRC0F_01850 [Cetobacterium sp.]